MTHMPKAKDDSLQVLITKEQYIEDIKRRWNIHTYEVNQLTKDIQKGYEFLSPFVDKSIKFVITQYQQFRSRTV